MKLINRLAVAAAIAALACTSVTALADDHGYTEGQVVNVARIRTVDGKFDEYMKWIDTKWKAQQEAAKKAGYLVSYEVLSVDRALPMTRICFSSPATRIGRRSTERWTRPTR